MSTTATTRLIVMLAFVRDEEGELQPAFEARECQSEGQAKHQALLAKSSGKYEGGIAWWREADLVHGDFGPPETIYQWGQVPEME